MTKTVRINGVFSGLVVEWSDEEIRIRGLGIQDKELKLVHVKGPHDHLVSNYAVKYREEERITHKMIEKGIQIGVDTT